VTHHKSAVCYQVWFAMLKVSQREMLNALEPATHFRPNFHKMVEYCTRQQFQLVVVSGGLGFCIQHFLAVKGWSNLETYTEGKTHHGWN